MLRAAVVIVLEDLHWGDGRRSSIVDAALAEVREGPLLVLGWRARGLRAVPAHLGERAGGAAPGELSRRAAERLARHVLGDGASASAVAEVVERAAGNAFTSRAAAPDRPPGRRVRSPRRVLAHRRGAPQPSHAGRRVRAPPACSASLLGRRRQGAGGGTLPDGEVEHCSAVRPRILRRRDGSRFAGEQELVFRHGLLREAAYAA